MSEMPHDIKVNDDSISVTVETPKVWRDEEEPKPYTEVETGWIISLIGLKRGEVDPIAKNKACEIFNILMMEDRTDEIDELLISFNFFDASAHVSATILQTIYSIKDKLACWDKAVSKVRKNLVRQNILPDGYFDDLQSDETEGTAI